MYIKRNVLGILLAMVVALVAFSSCDKRMDEPQNDLQSVQEETTFFLQGQLTDTRSSQGLGTIVASPQEGVANETMFSFSFTSDNPMMADRRVRLYVIFYAPLGGEYPHELNKTVYGETTVGTLSMSLQQVGTYGFRAGYSVDGGSVVPFDDTQSIVVTSNAIPLEDDYDPDNDSGYADNYCTAWVAWKINQMWGVVDGFYGSKNGNSLGNARDWKKNLVAKGYTADLSPQAGDVAWWGSNHVAFVNEVIDGNTVRITEYNNPSVGKGLQYHTRELYRNGAKGHKFPDAFIHVQSKI